MHLIDSKFYSNFMTIADYILLGMLWVVMSLPLITLVPATASMIRVIYEWYHGKTGNIISIFFKEFKQKVILRISLSIGLTIVYFVIYQNIALMAPISSNVEFGVLGILLTSGIIVTTLLIRWLHLTICYPDKKNVYLFKVAGYITVAKLHWTFLITMVLIISTILILVFPMTIFFISGFVALICYKINNYNLEALTLS